eukprot:CAMPEP_0170557648 /NCGR_PEP_ID=MMETSP0211-20121228/28807_1 /TAXON_ID=311385 /ORGANISM="Pseudokeronopsis sp., Strain OXSARD2" /LENGTH=83 /DNA_ID=CAMNT_0010868857 /DNA_START=375 /DNA_END=626 /DNA_ORIENTATION=-
MPLILALHDSEVALCRQVLFEVFYLDPKVAVDLGGLELLEVRADDPGLINDVLDEPMGLPKGMLALAPEGALVSVLLQAELAE